MARMDGSAGDPLPRLIRPMLAVPGSLPSPEEDGDWVYENKWDGARVVVYGEPGRMRALSRNDRDVMVSYPEFAALGARLGSDRVVLDGEVVCLDGDGKPSFGRLQRRMHVTSPRQAQQLSLTAPIVYVIFDLLYRNGVSLLSRTYRQRRAELVAVDLNGDAWRTAPTLRGSGAELLRASQRHGLEGLVAKRPEARYRPGVRSKDWRKIKNVRTQEVVIGGWKPGSGRRSGLIGSLLLGLPSPDGLRYVGHVGTGFTDRALRELAGLLSRSASGTAPFAGTLPPTDARDAQWVSPRIVGEVAFGEWTQDGRLRHPSWRGLRPDKGPEDVTTER